MRSLNLRAAVWIGVICSGMYFTKGWSAVGLPEVECPSQCNCWMHEDHATYYNNPPACYASSNMQLASQFDGCCQEIAGCTTAPCYYSATINASAQPGQACQFELFTGGVPVGPSQTGSTVTFNVPLTALSCGDFQSFVLRVNGTRVAMFVAHCNNC